MDVTKVCGRSHRSDYGLARCMFPRAVFVAGEGPVAVVRDCGLLTVVLVGTQQEMDEAMERCGVWCKGKASHRLMGIKASSLLHPRYPEIGAKR